MCVLIDYHEACDNIDLTQSNATLELTICDNIDLTQNYDTLEHLKCKEQIGVDFGCIPLSPLKLYTGSSAYWQEIPDIITANCLIRQSGVPNYLGLRIPVETQLNVPRWRH